MNKLVILALAALAISTSAFYNFNNRKTTVKSDVPAAILSAFNLWKNTHSKAYNTVEENLYRLKVFYQNFLSLKTHQETSYSVGLNRFADLTSEEFVIKYTGYRYEANRARNTNTQTSLGQQPPASVDWVKQGAVNGVKNQQSCGSCWAFSAVGAFESAGKIASGTLYSLSEQQLVDCSTKQGNHGCNGGLMDYAFTYIQLFGGLEGENDYPYKAADQPCKEDATKLAPVKVLSFVDVPQNDCGQLQSAIVKGPVSVAIAANAIQFYTTGVFTNKFCGTGLNHGVVAVGYGHDAASSNDFWLVRNSWGKTWGEDGYIRMYRGPNIQAKTGICGICMDPSYPVVA
jgi:C1A family cysteine protease